MTRGSGMRLRTIAPEAASAAAAAAAAAAAEEEEEEEFFDHLRRRFLGLCLIEPYTLPPKS